MVGFLIQKYKADTDNERLQERNETGFIDISDISINLVKLIHKKADNGNRTRLSSLGSWHTTDVLYLQ